MQIIIFKKEKRKETRKEHNTVKLPVADPKVKKGSKEGVGTFCRELTCILKLCEDLERSVQFSITKRLSVKLPAIDRYKLITVK